MSTPATKSLWPANIPGRGMPAIPGSSEATKFSIPERALASTESTGPAEPIGQRERVERIIVEHPPSQLLASSPTPEEGIPRSSPHTTSERSWDRLSVMARKFAKAA